MSLVMVPLDFSETAMCALKSGIAIANKLKANLRIVHVCPSGNYASGFESVEGEEHDPEQMLEHIIKENTQKYYGGGTFDYKLRKGNVTQELINQCKYDDATIVVAGSHGVSGITKSWIGGNAYKLICNIECPLLLIRPDMQYNENFQRIAIPVELKKSSRYKIPIVAGVAKLFGAKATVIGIQNSSFKSILTRITVSIGQVEKYLTKRANVEVEKSIMISGKDVAGSFIEAIADSKADMVAIDVTNTGSFIADRFRPFLTSIVNNSKCPVLAIPIKD